MSAPHFVLIYDTYCGWCYGAAKVIAALVREADVTALHLWLFKGANAPRMADGFGQMALKHDRQIERLTGQEFSDAYITSILRSPAEVLESSLTARAAALAHDSGAAVEMALAHALQKARYVNGQSAGDAKAVANWLVALGLAADPHAALRALLSDETAARASSLARDAAQHLSMTGRASVPTLLQRDSSGDFRVINIAQYYSTPETVTELLVA